MQLLHGATPFGQGREGSSEKASSNFENSAADKLVARISLAPHPLLANHQPGAVHPVKRAEYALVSQSIAHLSRHFSEHVTGETVSLAINETSCGAVTACAERTADP